MVGGFAHAGFVSIAPICWLLPVTRAAQFPVSAQHPAKRCSTGEVPGYALQEPSMPARAGLSLEPVHRVLRPV